MSEPLRRNRGGARDPRVRYAHDRSPDQSSRPWEHAGMRIAGGQLLVAGRDAEATMGEGAGP